MHSKIDQSTISKKNVNEWTPLPSKRPLIMSCTMLEKNQAKALFTVKQQAFDRFSINFVLLIC